MGGQACVFYGAAEFSRDTDLVILADAANLARLESALAELDATEIAVPPLSLAHLERGHAVHFRARRPDAAGMRIDVMARMRGVEPFESLWERRTVLGLADGETCDLIGIEDLVKAKKTQRDKDWPMIRRLVEAHYFGRRNDADARSVGFWLRELRTASLLVEACSRWSSDAREAAERRPLLHAAIAGSGDDVEVGLRDEELRERALDRAYWAPLRAELEAMRHARRAPGSV